MTSTANAPIFQQGNLKIELHFDKAEYLALPEGDKKILKSNFLFSRTASAWVSRAKEPNLYHAKQVAAKLGFTQEQRQGDRLTFAEQIERSVERAEARAERFEGYADNAERRAEGLQAEFNRNRKDWSWLTQPIISGHSGSQRFGRQRQRVMDRYDKGFEEYRKSEYFRHRAATAQNTADMKKFRDPIYLDNRIKECKKNVRAMERNLTRYEEIFYSLENHTEDRQSPYYGKYTQEQVSEWIENQLERLEAEIDKQGYMENCLDEIGGDRFSKENIKPGYIVTIRGSRRCEIISAGPVNVTYKILEGGAAGMVLTAPYAEINTLVEAKEVSQKVENPFSEGDILCGYNADGSRMRKAYQVIKVTATGVKIQAIAIEDNKPMPGQFTAKRRSKGR